MLTKHCCLGAKPAKPRIRQVLVFRARKESKEENGDDVIYGLRGTGPVQDQKPGEWEICAVVDGVLTRQSIRCSDWAVPEPAETDT